LELLSGQITALFGPNGAGKTTFLKLLAGIWKPDSGDISWLNKTVNKDFYIGYIGHELFLYKDLTARENLEFFGQLYNTNNLNNKINHLIKEAGLELWLNEPIRKFSRGMQQKLTICRTFLTSPDLLLLDEPFTGLDSKSAKFLIKLINLNKETPVLFSSHKIRQGFNLADNWLILKDGKIISRSKKQKKNNKPDTFIRNYDKILAGDYLNEDA
ncbi:MAG: ATP-binding cassette domain-containing protein, partial [Halarsenatibacteraceae bacterium]